MNSDTSLSKKGTKNRKGLSKSPKETREPKTLHAEIPDPIKGDPKLPPESVAKYDRGEGSKRFTTQSRKRKREETEIRKAKEVAARSELLLQETAGSIQKRTVDQDDEDDDNDGVLTQEVIRRSVDITTATKIFDLRLDKLGPYRHQFTRNGRSLILGGSMGHLAVFDWQTKRLACELSVNETVHDVAWLHNETMFAVAQKSYVYIYDGRGTELHCLRRIDRAVRLEFLPYHFLLAAGNVNGYLKYLDTSVGKFIGGAQTGAGSLKAMTQNPRNGVVMVGSAQGTVGFWSPTSSKALASVLTSRGGVRSISSTQCGNYFAAGSVDRVVSVWDVRMMKETRRFKTSTTPSHVAFSQKGVLAVGLGQVIDVFPSNVIHEDVDAPFLTHRLPSMISGIRFCPFEDVLGVSHATGYSSLIVPGSGEPNFDALETNPFQSTKMRQEAEVKALLEKVPPEMISLDREKILDVDSAEMKKKLAERKKVNYVKIDDVDFTPRHKKKGRSSAGKKVRRQQMVKSNHKRLVAKADLLNAKMAALDGKKKKVKEGTKKVTEGVVFPVTSVKKKDSRMNQSYALQRFAENPRD